MKDYYYEVHWLDGKVEIIKGTTFAMALTGAGYGNGAISAIDFYKQISATEAVNFNSKKVSKTETALRNYAKELNAHAKDGLVSTYWVNVVLETMLAELQDT